MGKAGTITFHLVLDIYSGVNFICKLWKMNNLSPNVQYLCKLRCVFFYQSQTFRFTQMLDIWKKKKGTK